MDMNTFVDILVMITPSLSAIATIIGGIIYIAKSSKKTVSTTLSNILGKQEKSFDDVALIKTKLASIEKYLAEKEKKKKWVKRDFG